LTAHFLLCDPLLALYQIGDGCTLVSMTIILLLLSFFSPRVRLLSSPKGGKAMIAKILIKRRFVKKNRAAILSLLNKMRSIAMNQPGYISGETLMQLDYPENMAVLCTWRNMEDWLAWKKSDERKSYESMLEIYQTRPTEFEEYLLGTSFP
jgi:heme-degrading monooxygenase HmoA